MRLLRIGIVTPRHSPDVSLAMIYTKNSRGDVIAVRISVHDPAPIDTECERLIEHATARQPGPYHDGSWRGMTLFGADPGGHSSAFEGTMAHLPKFARVVRSAPAIKRFLSKLPYRIIQARLMNLPPGATIGEHCDPWHSLEIGFARLNYVIRQPNHTSCRLDGTEYDWKAGELWWADFSRPHSVANGNGLRINLIIDLEVDRSFKRRLPPELRATAYSVPLARAALQRRRKRLSVIVPPSASVYFGGKGSATITKAGDALRISLDEGPTAMLIPVAKSLVRVLGCPPAVQFRLPKRDEGELAMVVTCRSRNGRSGHATD